MKQFVYLGLMALAAAATTACSSDDEQSYKPGEQEDRITFGNTFINKSLSQRATITTANLHRFKVWGFVETPESYVFDGTEVYLAGSDWRYDGVEYWYPGKQYWFTAVAPVGENDGWYMEKLEAPETVKSYKGGGVINFNNYTSQGATDLIYAFAGPLSYSGSGDPAKVSFTFNHILSQVRAEFTNAMTKTTSIKIEDVRFINAAGMGSVDMTKSNPSWTLSEGNDDYAAYMTLYTSMMDPDSNIGYNLTGASAGLFVIPTPESHKYQLGFSVLVFNGPTMLARYEHVVNLPETELVMGRSYNFKARLTPENINPDQQLKPIEFTVDQVNEWESDTDVNVGL